MRTFLSCLVTVLAMLAGPAFAQPDIVKRPVQFAKGKSGATIKGSLTGDQTHGHAGVARQLRHRQRAQVLRVEQALPCLEQRVVLQKAARLLGGTHAVGRAGAGLHL